MREIPQAVRRSYSENAGKSLTFSADMRAIFTGNPGSRSEQVTDPSARIGQVDLAEGSFGPEK